MNKPSSRRQTAAMETRRLILNAAKEFYSLEANAEAPVSRVAQKAGVAEGTIYAHFPDKPSLLAATLEDEIDHVLSTAWQHVPRNLPCSEQFLHLAEALYAFYSLRPSLFRVLLKGSLFLRGEWGMRLVDYTLRFVSQVAELINEAKVRGEYKDTINSLLAARNFFSLYFMELVNTLSAETFDSAQALENLRCAILQLEGGLQKETEVRE